MKHLQFSEDEFSLDEEDSLNPPPAKKNKTTDNHVPRKTNIVTDAKEFPSGAAMPPGYTFIRSDLIGNYCAYPTVPVPVVTISATCKRTWKTHYFNNN